MIFTDRLNYFQIHVYLFVYFAKYKASKAIPKKYFMLQSNIVLNLFSSLPQIRDLELRITALELGNQIGFHGSFLTGEFFKNSVLLSQPRK